MGAPHGARSLAQAARDRPAAVVEAAAVAAWALLLAHPLAVAAGVHGHEGPGVAAWAVMAAAMMLPGATGAATYVAVNSLRRRRHRAVALFAGAYGAVWAAYGAALLALPRPSLPFALAVAAAWQLSPWHEAALRGCHRTVPLPPTGRRAAAADVRFGLRHARACLGTCWALMAVMVAVPPAAHVPWTVALTGVVVAQRVTRRTRPTARCAAAGLATASVVALAGAAAWPLAAVLPVVLAVLVPGGRTWFRTRDLFGVNEALSH